MGVLSKTTASGDGGDTDGFRRGRREVDEGSAPGLASSDPRALVALLVVLLASFAARSGWAEPPPGLFAEVWEADGALLNGRLERDGVLIAFERGRLEGAVVAFEGVTVLVGDRIFVVERARLVGDIVYLEQTSEGGDGDGELPGELDLARRALVFPDGRRESFRGRGSAVAAGVAGVAVGYRAVSGGEGRTSVLVPAGRRALGFGAGGGPSAAVATLTLLDETGERSRADFGWFGETHSGLVRSRERMGFAGGAGLLSFDADYGWSAGRPAFALDTPGAVAANDRLALGASLASSGVSLGLRYRRERPSFVFPRRLDAFDGDLIVTERFGALRPTLHVASGHRALDESLASGVAARARLDATTASSRLAITPGVELRTGSTTIRRREDEGQATEQGSSADEPLGSTGFAAAAAEITLDARLIEAGQAGLALLAFGSLSTDTGDVAPADVRLWGALDHGWTFAAGPTLRAGSRLPMRASWLAGASDLGDTGASTLRLTIGPAGGRLDLEMSSARWRQGPAELHGAFSIEGRDSGWSARLVWARDEGAAPVRATLAPLRESARRLDDGTTLITNWRHDAGPLEIALELALARTHRAQLGTFGRLGWRASDGTIALSAIGGRALGTGDPTVFIALRTGANPGVGPISTPRP